MPANAQIYFGEIFKMIAFDPLEGIVDISGPVSSILAIKGEKESQEDEDDAESDCSEDNLLSFNSRLTPEQVRDKCLTDDEDDDLSTGNNLNETLEELGYESAYFVLNLGSLLLILVVQIILLPIYVLMWTCPRCWPKARNFSKNRLNKCFFNGSLTFIDGTFLVLLFMSMINLKNQYEGIVEADASYFCA